MSPHVTLWKTGVTWSQCTPAEGNSCTTTHPIASNNTHINSWTITVLACFFLYTWLTIVMLKLRVKVNLWDHLIKINNWYFFPKPYQFWTCKTLTGNFFIGWTYFSPDASSMLFADWMLFWGQKDATLQLRGKAWEIQAKSGICGNLFAMFSNNFWF